MINWIYMDFTHFVTSLLLEISKYEKSKFWSYNQTTFYLQISSISNFKKNI